MFGPAEADDEDWSIGAYGYFFEGGGAGWNFYADEIDRARGDKFMATVKRSVKRRLQLLTKPPQMPLLRQHMTMLRQVQLGMIKLL